VSGGPATDRTELPPSGPARDPGAGVEPVRPPAEAVDVDFLVVGTGLAGMYTALKLAPHGRCLLVTKARSDLSNSAWAQGGIAAALDAEDDPALHVEDTLRAGRGLCRRSAVEVLAREGPRRVEEMLALGVPFDTDASGRPLLGLEGGHGRRRIVHADGGATGQALVRALWPRVVSQPSVVVWEGARLSALLVDGPVCMGALVERGADRVAVRARATVLATGGACGLYARTTNPPTTSGDGIALAYLAGAAVADMEMVQFHPTAYALGRPAFLLSEALRGEGAQLWNVAGERFMFRYDPAGELAPRDVVARAITAEMARTGADHVQLRLDGMRPEALRRFAGLLGRLREMGVDPLREPIPVAPAAHYLMGGVVVDLDGRTTLERLYACGEVSCTGVHGANRLASNSLLECLVFGYRAAAAACEAPPLAGPLPTAGPVPVLDPEAPERRLLGEWLFADAGIVREGEGLRRLLRRLEGLPFCAERVVAGLIATAALARRESRGAHWRADFPAEDPALARHLVYRVGQPPVSEVWL
jgi:L-aspartate oxidase